MDELENFVVVHWNPARRIGTARPPESRHGATDGLFFGAKNIVTDGEQTLHPGSLIRGRRIADPKYPDKDALDEIEIYEEN